MANQLAGHVPTNWHIVGIGDFNGDGKSDVLWQSDAHDVLITEMNGTQVMVNQFIGPAPAGGQATAVADFNNDGMADILLASDAGGVVMLEMNGTQILVNQFFAQIPSNWHITGTGDVNGDGDGKSDVILTSDAGDHVAWQMNGPQIVSNQLIGPGSPPASPPQGAQASPTVATMNGQGSELRGDDGASGPAPDSMLGVLRGADPHALDHLAAAFGHDGHFLL